MSVIGMEPSGNAIVGVGTSTAGFAGLSADISGVWDPDSHTGMPSSPPGEPYEARSVSVTWSARP